MANVPTFSPGRAPDAIAPTPETHVDPSAFGAGIAESLSRLGDQVGRAGDTMFDAQQRRQAQNNLTDVDDKMNQLQEQTRRIQMGDPSDPSQPGFFGLQGQRAMQAWQPTLQNLQNIQQTLGQGMNADAARVFHQRSTEFLNGAANAMAQHVDQQRQAYQQDVFKATLDNFANSGAANLSDPSAFARAYDGGRQAVMQRLALSGVPTDSPIAQQHLQQWNDGYFSRAAQVARDNDDPLGAQTLLDSNRRNMSATAYALATEANRPGVYRKQGDMLGQSIINGTQVRPVPADADQSATFGAMLHLESGGRQTNADGSPLTSSKGAVGIAQMLPDTARGVARSVGVAWDESRFRTDPAYNRALGEAYFRQLCDRYGGNQTLACAAYNAGPGRVDGWLKTIGDPRTGALSDQDFVSAIPFDETRKYVSRAGAALTPGQPAPSFSAPDLSAQVSQVRSEAARTGLSPEAEARALSVVHQNYSTWQQATATARDQLSRHVADLGEAFLQGNTQQDIPRDQIAQLYEPEQARSMIDDLSMRRQAGTQYADLKWASPQQIAQVQQDDTNMLQGEDTDHYATRMKVVGMRNQMLAKRAEALGKDPASWVANNPTVQQAAQQIDPQNPATFQTYANTIMSVQRNLGVQQPRILSDDQVHQAVQTLTSIDPAKQDAVPVLNAMERHYGALWPQVFGEMVHPGGLSPEYQVLANMVGPGREMFASNLKLSVNDLKKAAGVPGRGIMPSSGNGDPIADTMAPFAATAQLQGGGVILNNMVRDAIERQALGYMARGQDQSTALSNAYTDIVGAKYDTAGTIRAPKGELPAVRNATAYMLSKLNPGDIQVPPELDGIPDNQRASYTIESARSLGQWVMNSDESGYNLMLPTRTPGQFRTLMASDGAPLTVTLQGVRSGQYANPYDSKALKLAQQAQAAYVAQHPEAR